MISKLFIRFIIFNPILIIIFIINIVLAISLLNLLFGYILLKNSESSKTSQLIKYSLILFLLVSITTSFYYSNDSINSILFILIGAISVVFILRLNSIFIRIKIYKRRNLWYENYFLATIYLIINMNWLLFNDLTSSQRPEFPKL